MSPRTTTASRPFVAILAALLLVAALPATVLAAAPANDERATAIAIGGLPFVDAQDTTEATTAADDPDCFGTGHSVWYRYDATEPVDLTANTFGSDYDTTLSVYVEDGGSLVQVACNDDWDSLQSLVAWTAEPGIGYWLMVGSFADSPGGNLVLSVETGTAPPPPPEPEPIEISVDVTRSTLHRPTGHVTVEGLVICSAEAEGYLFAEVRQRAGRSYIRGYGDTWVTCGPEGTAFSLTTFFEDGVFAGGPALVAGGAEVFNGTGYGFTTFEEQTRLQMVR